MGIAAAVQRLLESGHAYHCFCSPELLDQKRKEAAARKTDFKYDRSCLKLDADEVKRRLDSGERAAVRFKVPDGPVSFNDAVVGDVTISSEMIEDFVSASVERTADVSRQRRRGRHRHADHACHSRRRSHFEHAETDSAVSRAGAPIPFSLTFL